MVADIFQNYNEPKTSGFECRVRDVMKINEKLDNLWNYSPCVC